MLKPLSAMLDNFDTQMADYMADIDMQVQAFSSDPWLHDEAKMEEDAPGLKLDNFAHVKEGSHDQGDLTIEIDMEEHNSAEYDMVDDDPLQQPPEILDVEVYDASLAQSPAMGSLDSVLPTESSFSTLVVPPTEPQETDVTTASEPTLPAHLIAAPVASPVVAPVLEVTSVSDSYQDASQTRNTILSTHESTTYDVQPLENAGSEELAPPVDPEYSSSTDGAGEEPVGEISQEGVSERSALPDLQSHSAEDLNSTVVAPDEGPSGETESLETVHGGVAQAESTSSGDPHEISEGVYIDPPPAVLLTIFSDDHEYESSLFNEPAEWRLPPMEHHADAHRTLLHHLPTMYYDSVYSLFEALRQDGFIQSTFHLSEVELVLQAVDLGLTINEDNVYSRDVSLHDLNILHDGSAIGGPLRTRLYASNPRFIIQYHHLQEQVSRLQLGHQSRGVSFGVHPETHDSHIPDHQDVPAEEGELETHSTEPSEESAETEARLPQQNSVRKQVTDRHQGGHEDENRVGQTPDNDEDSPSDEVSPTDGYPTVQDGDHDSQSRQTEGEVAVFGLDVLEAEFGDRQRGEGEQDASASLHDESEGDEIEPADEQGLADDFNDTPQESGTRAEEKDEGDQEPGDGDGGNEQGDEISHEHSEYAEPEVESEPLPDQFQAFPQDIDRHDVYEEDPKKIDPTTPSDKADGQEYNEEEALPELPTDPISFDDETWRQELEDFENVDENLNDGDENEHSLSNHSSVTLSSRGSKRTFDEYESGGEGDEEEEQQWIIPASPDPKRTRTQ